MHMYICIYTHISLCLSLSLSVCMYIYIYLPIPARKWKLPAIGERSDPLQHHHFQTGGAPGFAILVFEERLGGVGSLGTWSCVVSRKHFLGRFRLQSSQTLFGILVEPTDNRVLGKNSGAWTVVTGGEEASSARAPRYWLSIQGSEPLSLTLMGPTTDLP